MTSKPEADAHAAFVFANVQAAHRSRLQCYKEIYCTRTPTNHSGLCNLFRLFSPAEEAEIQKGKKRSKGSGLVVILKTRQAAIYAAQQQEVLQNLL